jgi:NTE family protein
VVGAEITGDRSLDAIYSQQLTPADAEIGASFGLSVMVRLGALTVIPGDRRSKRRRIGAAGLKAHPESAEARVQVIGSRIHTTAWPTRDLRITAVDADTGDLKVFDRDSGADLTRAVAASCAVPLVWPPVPVDGRRYVDGGIRSTANVDLAQDADVVVVLAPLPRSGSRHHSIPAQLSRLGPGIRALVVTPDKAALAAFGRNLLDPAKRGDAARAGLAQSADGVAEAARIWPA